MLLGNNRFDICRFQIMPEKTSADPYLKLGPAFDGRIQSLLQKLRFDRLCQCTAYPEAACISFIVARKTFATLSTLYQFSVFKS